LTCTLCNVFIVYNRRLSLEVDQLLSELPPPVSTGQKMKIAPASVSKLQLEERSLKGQVGNLTGQRKKLSGELNGLLSQVSTHSLTPLTPVF